MRITKLWYLYVKGKWSGAHRAKLIACDSAVTAIAEGVDHTEDLVSIEYRGDVLIPDEVLR